MLRHCPIVAIALTLAFTFSVRGQNIEKNAGDPPDLTRQLDEAVLRAGLGQFWGAVLVADEGEVVLAKGYGLANDELDPITSESLFDIGSITKMFTAAAILRLQERGELSTDDPIAKFYPDLPVAAATDAAEKITLHHLLTHTSGKTDRYALQPLAFNDRDEAVRRFLKSQPHTQPGQRYEYCNAGYIVLAAVIEKVSGMEYETFMREQVLEPAGMRGSGFLDGAGLDAAKQTMRITSMRGPRSVRGLLLDKTVEPWGWGLKGAGGLVTSVNDLLQWDRAIAEGKLLGEDAMKKWTTPQMGGYAMGWRIDETDHGRVIHSHTGSTRGYLCELRRYPEEGVVIAVLTNEHAGPLLPKITKTLQETLWPPPEITVTATLDFSGPDLNEWRSIILKDHEQHWSVERMEDSGIVFELSRTDDAGTIAKVTMNAAAARQVARRIDRTLSAGDHAATPDGGVEVGIYGAFYTLGEEPGAITLPRNLSWRIMPMYRGVGRHGEPVHDPRLTIALVDSNAGGWPIMLKMDDPAARELAGALRAATQDQ